MKRKDMTLKPLTKTSSFFLFLLCFPNAAYSLETGNANSSNDKSAATGMLLFFGICLLVSGAMAVRNKQFGPEEGLRGNYIKGEKAVCWGYAQLLLGLVLVVILLMV
jgi:hypothetical protein